MRARSAIPRASAARVATREIYEGAQLTASDFSTEATSLSSALTDAERIVSVPLDAAHGLVGQAQEGDHVDVYAGFNVIPIGADGRPLNGGTGPAGAADDHVRHPGRPDRRRGQGRRRSACA